MKREHLIIDKDNSMDLSQDSSWRSVTLYSEGTPSWKAFGDGVKTLTIEKNMERGKLHIELDETVRETGKGKTTMISLNKETADTLVRELINFLGDK